MKLHVFGITYGRAKVGKTLAMARAFPTALFLTPPGGTLSAAWLGWEPKVVPVERKHGLRFVTDALRRASGKFPAVIVDDLSLIADTELELCKAAVSGYAAFDLFNRRVYDLRDCAREAKCHVFFTCHEQGPREVKKDSHNRQIPGAPLMPGWQVPEKLPAMADFVARVIHDPGSPGWPYLYDTRPDEMYVTGDRLSVFPGKFPMNLREAMLVAGYDLPRPEALGWMDEHVEEAADRLQEEATKKKPDIKGALLEGAQQIQNKDRNPRHVRWVLADALDRMALREYQQNLLSNFIQQY